MFTIGYHPSGVYYIAESNTTVILFTYYVKDQESIISYKIINTVLFSNNQETIKTQIQSYITQASKSGCCGAGIKYFQWNIKNDLTI